MATKLDIYDRQWTNAIARWKYGDTTKLEEKMRGPEPVPESARPFLADLIAGKAKKKRGRKISYPPLSVLAPKLMKEYEIRIFFNEALISERAKKNAQIGTPTERAFARCAEKFGMTEDQISKVVFPRKA